MLFPSVPDTSVVSYVVKQEKGLIAGDLALAVRPFLLAQTGKILHAVIIRGLLDGQIPHLPISR